MEPSYIKRYAKPLWDFLQDDSINEVAVNPDETVWIERAGVGDMEKTEAVMDANAIKQFTSQIAGAQKTTSGRKAPITSAMFETDDLPLRVQCVLPPACMGSGSITIRKFSNHRFHKGSKGWLNDTQRQTMTASAKLFSTSLFRGR